MTKKCGKKSLLKKQYKLLSLLHIKFLNTQEVLMYIKKLHGIILKQKARLHFLRKKLNTHPKQSQPKIETPPNKKTEDDERDIKVSDYLNDIKQAATENWIQQMGMQYEPTSGMYYHPTTGYYYNSEYNLYYDGNTGTYLKYNEESFEYEFHSKVETVSTQKVTSGTVKKENERKPKYRGRSDYGTSDDSESSEEYYRRSKYKSKKKKKHKRYSSRTRKKSEKSKRKNRNRSRSGSTSKEDGECSESDSSKSKDEPMVVDLTDDTRRNTDIAAKYPPSLRLIVHETNLKDKLKVGSLFVIPYTGGTLGREGQNDVIIPDENVSKTHLHFKYNTKMNKYECFDEGSTNGTIINGSHLSKTNSSMPLEHDSILELNKTKIICHIHEGHTTCPKCEPGLIQSKEEKIIDNATVLSHKDTLKQLKKMYGLEKEKYIDADSKSSQPSKTQYKNRAETRRKKIGGFDHNEKTAASNIETSISSDNKGFKMLSKLGWTAGQTLGKSDTGLLEPISIQSNQGTKGLGCEEQIAVNLPHKSRKKVEILLKTKQRFDKLKAVHELSASQKFESDSESD